MTDFLLGNLPAEECATFCEHLDTCEQCQSLVAEVDPPSDAFVESLSRPAPQDLYADEDECESATSHAKRLKAFPPAARANRNEGLEVDQLGPYRILEQLGAGGMGTVYKALHTKLDRTVAIKVLQSHRLSDPDALSRFEREMKAIGRLDHPNVVRATDADVDGGVHYLVMEYVYLVMEYVDGIDLSRLQKRLCRLPTSEACELIRQAAVGLEYIHEHDLVHRDIKPSNLMLTLSSSRAGGEGRGAGPQPTVEILDLGLALLNHDDVEGELTSTGRVMGTVDYMAPEQFANTHGVDIRADIYSLGATLYKLLTGRVPYPNESYANPLEKMAARARDEPESVTVSRPDLERPLVRVITRMLERNPGRRFQTPGEVVEALLPWARQADLAGLQRQAAADQRAITGIDRTVLARPVSRARNRRIGLWCGGAFGALLVLAAGVKQWTMPEQNNSPVTNAAPSGEVDTASKPQESTLPDNGDRNHGGAADSIRFLPETAPALAVAPFAEGPARQHQQAWADHLDIPVEWHVEVPDGPPMEFVLIPPGEFLMGPDDREQVAFNTSRRPQRRVEIREPFFLSKHEVTVGQFGRFVKETGHETQAEKDGTGARRRSKRRWLYDSEVIWKTPGYAQTDDHPVVAVNWEDAAAFCDWLNHYKLDAGFALPTDEQWEYACRAGSITVWHFGDGDESLHEYGWFERNAGDAPRPVGQLAPNAWGLHDMHGNVWEWCQYPTSDSSRVLRSGGWLNGSEHLRTATQMNNYQQHHRTNQLGFRVTAAVPKIEAASSR